MSRPKAPYPTPAELEILKILWEQEPLTVREVWDVLHAQELKRAYTSILSLMNVMTDKGLLVRKPRGRAFLYRAGVSREKALGGLLGDLWQRAFSGSSNALVAHLLQETQPGESELRAIRDTLRRFESSEGSSP